MTRFVRTHKHMLQKTATYYVMHIVVAAAVAYAVTGQLWMALTLSLLEPTVQAVAFFGHEKLWQRRLAAQAPKAAFTPAAPLAPQPTPAG